MRKWILMSMAWWAMNGAAQEADAFMTNGFWSNWYVQAGLDMSLQNPYGYDFSEVFPNGKTFGVDVAAGKWFTPLFGIRGRLNWENGIRLLENDHANWLAPFNKPGVNMDKGGYVALYGDVQFNLHQAFGGYDADRLWTAIVYPRAGAVYNCGIGDGSPVLGAGIENVFRLSDRMSLYLDVAYNLTSSAVTVPGNTGVDASSNGYLDVNVGVQLDLGKRTFDKEGAATHHPHAVRIGSFWDDWFIQAGIDMSLQNPYGYNFSRVFPKGKSYGIDVALGKWFTPEVAVRGKLNWENGLIENKEIEWVPPVKAPRENFEKHGYVVATMDVPFNMHNLIGGYDENRRWSLMVYPRAGIISHFGIGSASPLVGGGIENQYRIADRLSLYADIDYQVTTSESSVSVTGNDGGSNGFFKVELGVTYCLGKK